MRNRFFAKKKIKMRLASIFMRFSGLLLLTLGVLLCSSAIFLYQRDMKETYYDYVSSIVSVSRAGLDGDEIRDCIEKGELSPKLKEALEQMNIYKENSRVSFIYLLYYPDESDPENMRYVLYANTAADRAEGMKDSVINSPCGDEYTENMWKGFYEAQFGGKDEIRFLENITTINNKEVLMLTAFAPVYDRAGNAVCVIGGDIFADIVLGHTRSYLMSVTFIAIIILAVGLWGFIFIGSKYILKPVEDITKSATDFVDAVGKGDAPEKLTYGVVDVRDDTELRDLSQQLAHMMATIKDYMVNLKQITAEKERIGAELNVATQIQADMLPRIFPPFPEMKEIDLYATMKPAKEVGGDFYDFFLVDDDHICLVMADVSGKGVPAALFMVIAKTLIKNQAQLGKSPSEILANVNDQLCEGNEAELFVTVWLAIVEVSTGRGIAANAGHEHPAICRKGGQYELVVYRHSPAVATMEGLRFKEHSFELNPGDRLFVYTDGVAEATNASNELFGTDRMLAVLNKNPNASPLELLQNVQQGINEFVADAPQFDDITMLSFAYEGNEGKEV